MNIEIWPETLTEQKRVLARAKLNANPKLDEIVKDIVDDVKQRGDLALIDITKRVEGLDLASFRVPEDELEAAYAALSPEMKAALQEAKKNVTAFHEAQRPREITVETRAGVTCRMVWRAIDAVGLYVPGGTAPLFSSVMMLAIPALLAGPSTVVLCSPPQKNGKINQATLAAAWLCGIRQVFALGGAQAVAAMAYGTGQVPKVDKILGPGNAFVTKAKQLVALDNEGAAIDMPAGPSEVMVIAGPDARGDWVAADLLAQAEHDVVSQAILLTTDRGFAQSVLDAVARQLPTLSRKEIIEKCLQNSRILIVRDDAQAIAVANTYAPEHLIIYDRQAANWVPKITTAASVFLGPFSPETAGDYASGTNHVLPTYGAARAYSGLSLAAFLKSMTVQELTREGLDSLAPTLVQLAQTEGLDAHAAAVTIRLANSTGETT